MSDISLKAKDIHLELDKKYFFTTISAIHIFLYNEKSLCVCVESRRLLSHYSMKCDVKRDVANQLTEEHGSGCK